MKPFWRSRTLWLNVIGGAVLLAQGHFGQVFDPDVAACVLAAANVALRFVTHEPIGVR